MLAIRSDNGCVEAGNVDEIAGMQNAARGIADGLDVGRVVVSGNVGVFAVLAVIEEFANLDALDEIRHSSHVIRVEVGDEHLVDPGDAGVLHSGLDPLSIAAIVAGPAAIDEHRSARRRNKQGGLAAFDINDVDGQVSPFGLRMGGRREPQKQRKHPGCEQCAEGAHEQKGLNGAEGAQAVVGGNSHLRKSV